MHVWLVAFLMLPVTPVVERMSVLSRLRTLLYVAWFVRFTCQLH